MHAMLYALFFFISLFKVYLRALFDYTPFEDKATPCQEAGLPFTCGDILQVVSQDDPTWWQAKRVGDSNLRAGLIPSRQFQERYTTKIMSTPFIYLYYCLINHMSVICNGCSRADFKGRLILQQFGFVWIH